MGDSNLSIEEKQLYFDAFIEEYKEKELSEKQRILIDEYKELIAILGDLCQMYHIDYDFLLNKEIANSNKKNYTEEEFVDAIYVYTQSLQDALSTLLLQLMDTND